MTLVAARPAARAALSRPIDGTTPIARPDFREEMIPAPADGWQQRSRSWQDSAGVMRSQEPAVPFATTTPSPTEKLSSKSSGLGRAAGSTVAVQEEGESDFLDAVQAGLDVASVGLDATGAGALVSFLPDAFNAGISLWRGDTTGAKSSALAALPFFGAAANAARLGRAATRTEAFHYTFEQVARAIIEKGPKGGSYATPNGKLSPLQAHVDLALPPNRGLPNALVRVDLDGLRRDGYQNGFSRTMKGNVSIHSG